MRVDVDSAIGESEETVIERIDNENRVGGGSVNFIPKEKMAEFNRVPEVGSLVFPGGVFVPKKGEGIGNSADGTEFWRSRRLTALRERRYGLTRTLPPLDSVNRLSLSFVQGDQ